MSQGEFVAMDSAHSSDPFDLDINYRRFVKSSSTFVCDIKEHRSIFISLSRKIEIRTKNEIEYEQFVHF